LPAGFRKIIRIVSNLLEKKTGLFLKRFYFSGGSANRGGSLKQVGPLPGQKNGSERPTNLHAPDDTREPRKSPLAPLLGKGRCEKIETFPLSRKGERGNLLKINENFPPPGRGRGGWGVK